MCGIAGAFGPDRPDDGRIERTLALMRNRGPDARGAFRGMLGENNVTLLATRLAIIDLDPRANQPFEHDDCVIAYNGEAYNYLEVRSELEAAGHVFRTNSDTEVMVQAYRRHGEDFVDRLEGMWAFALVDRREGRLVLSRDRFGEKPLYYMEVNGTLYFASEVKFLVALSGHKPPVNPGQIRRYLVNGYKALYKGGDTFFEGVSELPPAHQMTLTDAPKAEARPYWRLAYRPRDMTAEEAREGARDRLFEAIRLRLRADVPLAFCLSGGIDSGTLVSIAGHALGHDVHAFSIIDGDPRYNERDNIMAVVDDLGCAHHLVHTSPDGFFDRMKALVSYHDMPVATINYYMHAFLSEAIAEQGFKVVLSGTAADELFTGYYDHYGFWLAEMQRRPDFPRLIEDWKESYGRFVRNPLLQSPTAFVNNPDQREHIYLNQDLFEGYLTQPFHEDFREAAYSDNLLRNRMLNELFHESVPVLLREDDLNSMLFSIENRSPYLDRRLAEFMYEVPAEHLIHDGYAKWLLRAAGDGLLVDKVRLDKRKRGFNTSIDSLVDRSDPATRDFLLDDSPIFDLVRREALEQFIDGDLSDNSFSKFMFSFVSAKVFLEQHQGTSA